MRPRDRGVKGFTESVSTELAHERSRVLLCMVQLPAVNTPQFTWNLNRMPRNLMPVPPAFAPEVCARAIAFLAEDPRRNMWVGQSTLTSGIRNRGHGSIAARSCLVFPSWWPGCLPPRCNGRYRRTSAERHFVRRR